MKSITPAMKQYYEIKEQYKDALLFFRMWDFYEMFEEDAQIAHRVLWITLTSRNKNAENPILLAGIPFHAKEKYLPRLIEAGYKVAIAEQVSDPKAKGIVERQVQRVVTPATLGLENEWYTDQWDEKILISICELQGKYSISSINLDTHKWSCSEFEGFDACAWYLYKVSPKEVILEKSLFSDTKLQDILSKKYSLNVYFYEFSWSEKEILTGHLGTKNLHSFGIEDKKWAQRAASIIISYLSENQKTHFDFLRTLTYEDFSGYMQLDESTIKSLDLIYSISTNSATIWTLFGALDDTKTPMGKRYLKRQILEPLLEKKEIEKRQKFIWELKTDTILLTEIRNELKYVSDIDTLLTRLSLDRVWPRDLLQLKKSLIGVRNVINLIKKSGNNTLIKLIT